MSMEEIKKCEKEIEKVCEEIEKTGEEIRKDDNDEKTLDFLRENLRQLREEKGQLREQLREEKRHLREERQLERERGPPAKKKKLPQNSSSTSVSQLAKDSLTANHRECPVYFHWFALQLYNLYREVESMDVTAYASHVELNLLDNVYHINKAKIQSCADTLLYLNRDIHQMKVGREVVGIASCPNICNAEITYSSIFARTLDRFLFSDEDCVQGAALHQFPSRIRSPVDARTIEKMDMAVVSMPAFTPLLCSDLKKENRQVSENETTLYAVNCARVQLGDPTWPLILGISGTPEAIALHCFVPVDGSMWRTKIFQCTPDSVPFLCTLFCAVKQLIKKRIVSPQPIEVYQPLKDKVFEVVDPSKPRVLKSKNMLYKLYDSEDKSKRRHNNDLLSKLSNDGCLPRHDLQPLSNDERFSILSRPFIEGSHIPNHLSDFVGAVTCLKKVHDLGYIHADVRLSNIIFADGTSHLIDFDLAVLAAAQQTYPCGYRSMFNERHRFAKDGCLVKKEHDIYSMQKIIREWFNFEECKTIEEILALLK